MRSHPSALGALLVLGIASLAATGCSEPRGSAPPDRPSSVPVAGGTFRMALEAPHSLDPSRSDSVYESLPINQLFDGLVDLDASLGIRPALAQTWTLSGDGLTYTFHLRPGVRFHDGRPLTASDVRFTLERLLCPVRGESPLAAPYLMAIEGAGEYVGREREHISGVTVIDPTTVSIRLEHAYPLFLEVLAIDGLNIVPEHVLRSIGNEEFGRHPVGTGPFRLESWTDRRLVLAANDDYFLGRPHLDRVELQFFDENDADYGAERFFAGQLDVLEPPTAALDRLSNDDRYELRRYPELSLSFLGFGTTMAPVDRVEVRQAIAHAIDRERLVRGSPLVRREAVGILPPGMMAYSPDPKALSHDPDRARLLLRRAGYDADHPVEPLVVYTTSTSAAARELFDAIESDLAAVAIPLEVRAVDWTELTDRIETGRAPAFLLAWIADMNDPDAFLRGVLDIDGSGNSFGFEDPVAAKMLDDGLRELSPAERTRIYRRVESRILTQAPLVPLYHTLGVVATRKTVHGFEPGPMGVANLEFEKVWVEHGAVARLHGGAP